MTKSLGYRAIHLAAEVGQELERATGLYRPMHSAHEGYAVIKEELDELWDEIKVKQLRYDFGQMRKEAIQVAAMAMRFVLDVCDKEGDEE